MPDDQDTTGPLPSTWALLRRNPGGVAGIVAVLTCVIGVFGYVGGFVGSDRLSSNTIVDVMEEGAGGPHAGFRRAHAKGMCFSGSFVGTAAGRAISSAALFDGHVSEVVGRFAQGSADPHVSDTMSAVRSMALQIRTPDGAEWRAAMNNTPGLHVSTVAAFYENALASVPDPKTGKPDPDKVAAFLARHPETVAFRERMRLKPVTSGFANDRYNSINGFVFAAPDGQRRLVRWSMEPRDAFATLAPEFRAARSPNYAFDDLTARVARGPVQWRMVATLARPGDPNRAAELWPEDREKVVMGTLTIDRVAREAAGNCRDVVYDPMILPPGMEPSDDPLPIARSAAYAASFRRRAGEAHAKSGVRDLAQ